MSTLQQRVPRTLARPVLAALTIGLVFALAPTGGARETTTAKEMRDAATAFLATLDAGQKTAATFPFTSDERENWFFTPVPRKGLAYFSMTDAQRAAAVKLLKTGLSAKGFAKVEAHPLARVGALRGRGRRRPEAVRRRRRAPAPLPRALPVHHLRHAVGHRAVGLALRRAPHLAELDGGERLGDRVAARSSSAATRPKSAPGPKTGLRVLAAEEDLARTLLAVARRDAASGGDGRRRRRPTTSSRPTSTRPSGCPTSASPTAP